MKILYISKPFFVDSDLPLIREYQRQGHDVTYLIIVTPYSRNSTLINITNPSAKTSICGVNNYKELSFFNSYFNTDGTYIAYSVEKRDSSFKNFLFFNQLNKFINNLKPDVIHITFPPVMNELLLYKHRKKMVMTVHDPIVHSGEESFKREFFRNIAFHVIPKLIVLSKHQKRAFCEKYNIKQDKVYQSNLGVYDALRLFKASDNKVPDKNQDTRSINILFFGRISPYKGLEYLLQSFSIVQNRLPNAKLTIAGSGKLYFDYSAYEDNENINLINRYISTSELYSLLTDCDIVVCPYLDATQSGVIMTCFGLCKPVIATNVGNFAEVIHNGETGFIVEPRDVNSLAEKILMVANNDGLLSKMEENIRQEFYMGNSSWSNIAKRNIEIYTDN